jgi:hypothetical protein
MELWQMDVMGRVKLTDGSEAKIVTGIDDHSRFCVSALVVQRATAMPVCDALALAMRRHGVPDQILTDNGKVFTGRFGPGNGEVLFDRICRENGIHHLLTAPRSPTTTGKVERFHKTVRGEFLTDRVFESIAEAQGELDGWVERYNTIRPHQGIGMVPPIRRFELAVVEPFELRVVGDDESPVEPVDVDGGRRVTRKVGAGGRISLAGFKYHVGRWLGGETVDVVIADGLIEITHRDVLITSHARQHRVEDEPKVWQREPRARPVRPETVGVPVTRKVDSSGNVSFAATPYRAGNAMRGRQVNVQFRFMMVIVVPVGVFQVRDAVPGAASGGHCSTSARSSDGVVRSRGRCWRLRTRNRGNLQRADLGRLALRGGLGGTALPVEVGS